MKKFEHLTKEQKIYALEFARSELRECIKMGLITLKDREPNERLITKWSIEAARGSWYNEEGKPVT